MLTIMVSGSREWKWNYVVNAALDKAARTGDWEPRKEVTLIQGAARGADQMARSHALRRGWDIVDYRPNYTDYGKAATHIRNAEMVAGKPDIALFFVRDMSSGTMTTLEKVVKARIRFEIYWHDNYNEFSTTA